MVHYINFLRCTFIEITTSTVCWLGFSTLRILRARTYQGHPTSQGGVWGINGTLPDRNCVEESFYGSPKKEEVQKLMMRKMQALGYALFYVERIGRQRAP